MIRRIAEAKANWEAAAIETCRNDQSIAALGLCHVCLCSHPCLCEDAEKERVDRLDKTGITMKKSTSEKSTPKPPPCFNAGGFVGTGNFRIRPTWFFGFCVVEELHEYRDGSHKWLRVTWPATIEMADATLGMTNG